MKTQWRCACQLLPNPKKYSLSFSTEKAARRAMGRALRKHTDIDQYIQSLKAMKEPDCKAAGDYLDRFLTQPELPENDGDLPYFDIPGYLAITSTDLRWRDHRNEAPNLLVRRQNEDGEFVIDLCYDNPQGPKKVSAVNITMAQHAIYSYSDHPLLVLRCLEAEPATQEQISQTLRYRYGEKMDRKAVGRHLNLLKSLGYPVQHCAEGYYREGQQQAPDRSVSYGSSAYPLMILLVLDQTPKKQARIIAAIQETFGVTMDRKAVSRHLSNLKAMGYPIVKAKDGYRKV